MEIKERDFKLEKSINKIEKKILVNKYINTINDVFLIKRFTEAIPIAKAYNFFDTLKDKNNLNYTRQKYLYEIVYYLDITNIEILRKKNQTMVIKI